MMVPDALLLDARQCRVPVPDTDKAAFELRASVQIPPDGELLVDKYVPGGVDTPIFAQADLAKCIMPPIIRIMILYPG